MRVDSPPLTFNGLPLSKALQELRLRSGISQTTLAHRLDVSKGTLRNWESGLTQPTKAFWPAIKALICPA